MLRRRQCHLLFFLSRLQYKDNLFFEIVLLKDEIFDMRNNKKRGINDGIGRIHLIFFSQGFTKDDSDLRFRFDSHMVELFFYE